MIAVVGFTMMLIGLALLVLPGLAFIMIPLGLGIVAIEFVWVKALAAWRRNGKFSLNPTNTAHDFRLTQQRRLYELRAASFVVASSDRARSKQTKSPLLRKLYRRSFASSVAFA